MQIHFDSYTVFTNACHWISRYLVLIFWINELSFFESSECFTLGLGKTLINCILIKSSPQYLTKQNQDSLERLCSDLVVLYKLLKWQGIDHSYFEETTWVITLVCQWSSWRSKISRHGFSCFVGSHLRPYSTLHGKLSFSETNGSTTKGTGSEILLKVVHYEFGSWCFSQENQVGYDGGGGTIIFIAWIKFFSFDKHFWPSDPTGGVFGWHWEEQNFIWISHDTTLNS